MTGGERGFGLGRCVALTLGSALVWGTAHLATGHKRTGMVLLTAWALLAALVATLVLVGGPGLLSLAVQPGWLTAFAVALATVAAVWTIVIVWSYVLVRPANPTPGARVGSIGLAAALCALIIAPSAYATRLAYLSHDVVTSVFSPTSTPVIAQDPWNGAKRVNILLIGADAAPNRPGVRTDSMTVASIDTATGATTLFGLPRNLQNVQFPPGPARQRFPYGFTGEPPYTPGLLNEVFQYAEDYPEMVPGVHRGQRGPALLKRTVGSILGLPVPYYAMVDMAGFAQIIDAMGGVKVTIREPITYGKYSEGYLPAGTRKLSGQEALWYGRSRTNSDDYVRMGRQKCLLNAVAKQADPITVLNSFEKLATATKRAISTDLPQSLLPALIDLAAKVKGTQIKSLQFVPPLISTVYPDWDLIQQKVDAAIADRPAHRSATAKAAPAPGARPSAPSHPDRPVSLDEACG
ncbi:LCP family protein [Nonomuraea sp. NPDC050328]|uniref:LCP family protein n=1 Tax=Nonomuraea sp. NPDC050328 TaxID=3364361 RepID=UPI00379C7462